MADKTKFSIWLKTNREAAGWSQSDLAREANVTRAAINGIETEARGPGIDLCISLAKAFRLPPDEVFRIAGLLPPKPDADPMQDQLDYLYSTLKDPANKRRAINFIKLLNDEEAGTSTLNPKTQPR